MSITRLLISLIQLLRRNICRRNLSQCVLVLVVFMGLLCLGPRLKLEQNTAPFEVSMPASHMKEGDARQHMKEGDAAKIAKKWDEAVQTFVSGGTWHQHPLVVSTYKNRLSAGSINFVEHLKERYGVLDKCISIGCGDGGIEQEMVIGGLCKYMRGIDLSPVRVKFANDHVPDELRSQLEFHVQNAETDLNEQEFDMVLFTHALHHIFDLESMSSAIKSRVLKPGGILVLEEYVGPVRWQFPPSQLTEMELFLTRIEVSKFRAHLFGILSIATLPFRLSPHQCTNKMI